MERTSAPKLIPVLLAFGLAVILFSVPCRASYDFTFTTQDFALEAPFWGQCIFKTVIENTGTTGDTLIFVLTKNLPPSWFGDFCLRGRCFNTAARLWFAPGQKDTIDADIFVADFNAMGTTTLTVTMKSDPGVTHSATYAGFAEKPSILLVDDDAGATYETYMLNALQAAGYFARVWDAFLLGRPGETQLKSYWGVLWTTADGDASYITAADEADLSAFLDAGGKLFLASQDFISSHTAASPFMTDYLHIPGWAFDIGGSPITGVAGDPISDGMSLDVTGGPFSAARSDDMVLSEGSGSIFSGAVPGTKGMKTFEPDYQVVFISFPFEVVSTVAANPNNQNTLMARVMDWFDPPVAGVVGNPAVDAPRLVLGQNAPNPFGASTRISFLVKGGSDNARLSIYDVRGEVVRTLVSGPVGASETAVVWDGSDSHGTRVAPGIYFARLAADGSSVLKKMVVIE
jgi:hypothetical protein